MRGEVCRAGAAVLPGRDRFEAIHGGGGSGAGGDMADDAGDREHSIVRVRCLGDGL